MARWRIVAGACALVGSVLFGAGQSARAVEPPPPIIADGLGINDHGDVVAFVDFDGVRKRFMRIAPDRRLTEIALPGGYPDWSGLPRGVWNGAQINGLNNDDALVVTRYPSQYLVRANGQATPLSGGFVHALNNRTEMIQTTDDGQQVRVIRANGSTRWNVNVAPAFLYSQPALNDAGEAVVTTTLDGSVEVPLFIDAHGGQHPLPLGDYTSAEPLAINNRGDVAGFAYDDSRFDYVVWSKGKAPRVLGPVSEFRLPSVINDHGQILIGRSNAMVYDRGAFITLKQPGQTALIAYDMNESGVVVGVGKTATTLYEGFAWNRHQGQVKLGPPTGDRARCGIRVAEIVCAGDVTTR
jgi:hypothetical protein